MALFAMQRKTVAPPPISALGATPVVVSRTRANDGGSSPVQSPMARSSEDLSTPGGILTFPGAPVKAASGRSLKPQHSSSSLGVLGKPVRPSARQLSPWSSQTTQQWLHPPEHQERQRAFRSKRGTSKQDLASLASTGLDANTSFTDLLRLLKIQHERELEALRHGQAPPVVEPGGATHQAGDATEQRHHRRHNSKLAAASMNLAVAQEEHVAGLHEFSLRKQLPFQSPASDTDAADTKEECALKVNNNLLVPVAGGSPRRDTVTNGVMVHMGSTTSNRSRRADEHGGAGVRFAATEGLTRALGREAWNRQGPSSNSFVRDSVCSAMSAGTAQTEVTDPLAVEGSSSGGSDGKEKVFSLSPDWQQLLVAAGTDKTITLMSKAATTKGGDDATLHQSQSFWEDMGKEDQEGIHCAWMRYFITHPSSTQRLTWDLVAMGLLAYDVIMIPLLVFQLPDHWFLLTMIFASQCFWSVDILASFLVGFHERGYVVMDPRLIATRYVRSWFCFDIVVVGLDWFLWFSRDWVDDEGHSASMSRWLRLTKFARFLRATRLLRLMKLKRIINEIHDRIDSESMSTYFQICSSMLCILAINHVIACCWYGLSLLEIREPSGQIDWVTRIGMDDASKAYLYTTSLHWSLTQFTPASMEVQPSNVIERIFTVIVVLFALCVFSSFLSGLTSAMAHLRSIKNEESRQFWLLRRYLKASGVHKQLGLRIQRYLEFVQQSQCKTVRPEDVTILRLLTTPLQNELRFELHTGYLEKLPVFRYIRYNLVHFAQNEDSRVMLKMWFNVLAPMPLAKGDTVFECYEVADRVLVNTRGSLYYRKHYELPTDFDYNDLPTAIKSAQEIEKLKHLERRPALIKVEVENWICQPVLWTKWVHVGDLMAHDDCLLLTLDPAIFVSNVRTVPNVSNHVAEFGRKFVDALNDADATQLSDVSMEYFKFDKLLWRRAVAKNLGQEGQGHPFGGAHFMAFLRSSARR